MSHILARLTAHCALALIILVATFAQPARADSSPLYMGLVAADSREVTLERWKPLLEDMSRAIGRPVEALTMDDYAGIIWSLKTGKAQLAWMGNKSAIEAVDRANCEVLVMTLSTTSGSGYYSHLIVPSDSKLDSVDDVLNNAGSLTFGNGDPNSTSGFVVPGFYVFATRGIDPNRSFKRVVHNNHEDNFYAVASKEVDVATNNSLSLARHAQRSPKDARRIRIIWTSPRIPNDPIVVRKELAPELKRKIESFLIGYGKSTPGKSEQEVMQERELLSSRNWAGYIRSDDSQLIPIRKLELFKERKQVETAPDMPEAPKRDRLEAIDRQLRKLNGQD